MKDDNIIYTIFGKRFSICMLLVFMLCFFLTMFTEFAENPITATILFLVMALGFIIILVKFFKFMLKG